MIHPEKRRDESRRGTQECSRHGLGPHYFMWIVAHALLRAASPLLATLARPNFQETE